MEEVGGKKNDFLIYGQGNGNRLVASVIERTEVVWFAFSSALEGLFDCTYKIDGN